MKKSNNASVQLIQDLAELLGFPKREVVQFKKLFNKLLETKVSEVLEEKKLLDPHPKQIFVFGSDKRLGNKIASLLKTKPAPYDIKCFDDNERIPHQTLTVCERDVYIILTSQKGKAMDKWKNDYLSFTRSIKWGRPYRITIVLPLWYQQRADVENFELREPKMSHAFAELLKVSGADRIITCKLHNPASSVTDPQMMNIGTSTLLVKNLKSVFNDFSNIAFASGDMGGAKYTRKIASQLGCPVIITDKNRDAKTGSTIPMNIYFDQRISEKIDTVIFTDDVISTFGTLKKAGAAIQKRLPQIKNYIAVVTHPDFVKSTADNITSSVFKSIWVTDTVPVSSAFIAKLKKAGVEMRFMSVAKLLARIIDNLHNNVPVSDLWTNGNAVK